MSRPRTPRVVGVGGGVGTTTVATALRGHDLGRTSNQGADVLVCRSTAESLLAAASHIAWLVDGGAPPPTLAVTSDAPLPLRSQLRAQLRATESRVAAVVVLPYVPHWRELAEPLSQVARLSGCAPEQLPRSLRDYGRAVEQLAEALLSSGLLGPTPAARQPTARHAGARRPGAPEPSPDVRPRSRQACGQASTSADDREPGGISNFGLTVTPAVLYGAAP